jgi:hypothetical protein
MALYGLPDLPSTLSELINGPRFITGEPRREWSFLFRLVMPPFVPSRVPKWVMSLFNTLALLYVSGLAEKVTLPADKFTFDTVQFSTLKVPFPKGFELPHLQVQYLDDELGLVYIFHRVWQSNIRGYLESGKRGGGVVFEELGKVCASALYAPGKRMPWVGDIPLGGEMWPLVFPVDVTRDSVNRGGNNVSKVNVTYARVPKWSMDGNIYEWNAGVVAPSETVNFREADQRSTKSKFVSGAWPD